MKLIASEFSEIYLCVEHSFHCDSIVTNCGKFVPGELWSDNWELWDSEQASIGAISWKELRAWWKGMVRHSCVFGFQNDAVLAGWQPVEELLEANYVIFAQVFVRESLEAPLFMVTSVRVHNRPHENVDCKYLDCYLSIDIDGLRLHTVTIRSWV